VRWTAWLAANPEALAEARRAARRAWEDGGHDPDRAAAALRDVVEELGGSVV
jgi:hypothetical protein